MNALGRRRLPRDRPRRVVLDETIAWSGGLHRGEDSTGRRASGAGIGQAGTGSCRIWARPEPKPVPVECASRARWNVPAPERLAPDDHESGFAAFDGASECGRGMLIPHHRRRNRVRGSSGAGEVIVQLGPRVSGSIHMVLLAAVRSSRRATAHQRTRLPHRHPTLRADLDQAMSAHARRGIPPVARVRTAASAMTR